MRSNTLLIVWALANVRKTGYASISVFAAACSLFIHTNTHCVLEQYISKNQSDVVQFFQVSHHLNLLSFVHILLYQSLCSFKRYQIVIIPDNRIIAGNTYTACYYKSFGINPNNGNQMTPPTLVEPENDKIFERLHTARTAIPNHLPAITLLTNPAQTRIHPGPPRPLPPRAILFSLFFSFVYAGFRGLRAPGRGIWQGARVQKKPYAVGVPQHKASLVYYVVLGLREGRGDAQLSCHFQVQ